MLAIDEAGNVFHRPRPVQRVHGDEVCEFVGLELPEIFLHADTFKLESACGFSALKECVRGFIVKGDIVHVDVNALAFPDVLQRRLDYC